MAYHRSVTIRRVAVRTHYFQKHVVLVEKTQNPVSVKLDKCLIKKFLVTKTKICSVRH